MESEGVAKLPMEDSQTFFDSRALADDVVYMKVSSLADWVVPFHYPIAYVIARPHDDRYIYYDAFA